MTEQKPGPDEEVSRDQLGNWWPSLAGRHAEWLATHGRGPPYRIGRKKKAWYLVRDVDAWVESDRDRQMMERPVKSKPPRRAPPLRQSAPPGKPPKKRRLTKLEKYLASLPR